MVEYFSTIDHQSAFLANIISIITAYLFTEKSNKAIWFGVLAEVFWIIWIWETKKWEIFPVEFLAFVIYFRGCIKQMKEINV